MRSSDLRALGLLSALALAGCETELPGGDLSEPATQPEAAAPLPVVPGCMPFRSLPGVSALNGAVRSLVLPDGSALLVVDDATAATVDVPSLALTLPAGAGIDDCLASASVAFGGPTSAFDPPSLSPLSGVVAAGTTVFYYADGSGSIGVAAQGGDGRFRPTAMQLWTSDRPPYGTAAVVDGEDIDVLGCVGARFLDTDCFAAQAAASSVADESAYQYYVGGGRFSPRVDDAWPVTTGPTSFDLVPVGDRWVLIYVTPLGSTITVRSGLTPFGPWSAPIDVAACDLADPDMFCGGIHLHPEVTSPPGTVVLSYAPVTLSSDAAARRIADPDKWWPRFVALELPALP